MGEGEVGVLWLKGAVVEGCEVKGGEGVGRCWRVESRRV